jgi:hypothetical protein
VKRQSCHKSPLMLSKMTPQKLSSRPRETFLVDSLHCRCHVISARTGISFFTGIVSSYGGSILNSESVAGIVPVMRTSPPCFSSLKEPAFYSAVWPVNSSI